MTKELINPAFPKRGYIQVYTGNGKGKTTATLGLTLRALGRGWKVMFVFFTKGGGDYGEVYSFKSMSPEILKNLTIINAGTDKVLYLNNITDDDRKEIQKGWSAARKEIISGDYQLIVLDEMNICIDLGLVDVEEVKHVLENKAATTEVVLTGRNAHPDIKTMAHLVSEILPVKHYWDIGVTERSGMER
jgi:cob(I)alamin adenosyltransferase